MIVVLLEGHDVLNIVSLFDKWERIDDFKIKAWIKSDFSLLNKLKKEYPNMVIYGYESESDYESYWTNSPEVGEKYKADIHRLVFDDHEELLPREAVFDLLKKYYDSYDENFESLVKRLNNDKTPPFKLSRWTFVDDILDKIKY